MFRLTGALSTATSTPLAAGFCPAGEASACVPDPAQTRTGETTPCVPRRGDTEGGGTQPRTAAPSSGWGWAKLGWSEGGPTAKRRWNTGTEAAPNRHRTYTGTTGADGILDAPGNGPHASREGR